MFRFSLRISLDRERKHEYVTRPKDEARYTTRVYVDARNEKTGRYEKSQTRETRQPPKRKQTQLMDASNVSGLCY